LWRHHRPASHRRRSTLTFSRSTWRQPMLARAPLMWCPTMWSLTTDPMGAVTMAR
jgi:hypothetical protein